MATTPGTAPTNYTSWTQEALISRIQGLEQSLALAAIPSTLPHPHPSPQAAASAPPKPRKKPRTFDPSQHRTQLTAFKLTYLGTGFSGLEHSQPDQTTIESCLFHALLKARLVPPAPDSPHPVESVLSWPFPSNYSKCGRTDRGVSSFGQVIAVEVRVAPEGKPPINYCTALNRLLPPTIRVVAYSAPGSLKPDFSARFDCLSRTYRYFFTNPMIAGPKGELDTESMNRAAGHFLGTHDFRNFCKLDPSKQITNFVRKIMLSRVVQMEEDPGVYYFELQGTAFLWHQVRHMVAVLFLVGQRLERPEIVRDMLDLSLFPTKPVYEMACEAPLVLWDCKFREEDVRWLPAERGGIRDTVLDTVWGGWQKTKIDEVLARELRGVVEVNRGEEGGEREPVMEGVGGHFLITGDGEVTPRGVYVPLEKRERMRDVTEINKSYLEKKGDWRERKRKRGKDSDATTPAETMDVETGEEAVAMTG